ncbi:MAG TPA: urease accessory protein UreE, partial [Candidatus Dormibacteraeota bacterium]|nr:urease accessory protein UreE [Candidatus Dormibacteraeota bacterium]
MAIGVPVVEAVLGNLTELDRPVEAVDELDLTAEERERAHLRARSRGNRELIISLPRGVELHDGDVVYIEDGVTVVVVAAPEDVLEVSPRTPREWALAAYQLGNLHRPARFLPDAILTPYDRSSAETLRALGVATHRVKRGFVGERCRA